MILSLKEDIDSMSHVKANFTDVLKERKKKSRPLIITQNGKSSGVLLDIGSWENIIRKINLLKLLNEGEESLENEAKISLVNTKRIMKDRYGF